MKASTTYKFNGVSFVDSSMHLEELVFPLSGELDQFKLYISASGLEHYPTSIRIFQLYKNGKPTNNYVVANWGYLGKPIKFKAGDTTKLVEVLQ